MSKIITNETRDIGNYLFLNNDRYLSSSSINASLGKLHNKLRQSLSIFREVQKNSAKKYSSLEDCNWVTIINPIIPTIVNRACFNEPPAIRRIKKYLFGGVYDPSNKKLLNCCLCYPNIFVKPRPYRK